MLYFTFVSVQTHNCIYYHLYQESSNFVFVVEKVKGSEKKFSNHRKHEILMSNEVRLESCEDMLQATFKLDGCEIHPSWWLCNLIDITRFKTHQFIATGLDSTKETVSEISLEFKVNNSCVPVVKRRVKLPPREYVINLLVCTGFTYLHSTMNSPMY